MTSSEEIHLLEKRKAGFDAYYKALLPTLVEFVRNLGINPAHEVLRHAPQYSPYLDLALRHKSVADDKDRQWLLTNMGYFIGEYFVQKYSGSWLVSEIPGSRYFCRYVVGRFARVKNSALMLDPFEVARAYVDTPVPRNLESFLSTVDAELLVIS
jgi:hypothetical protein